ncbi:3-oxoadipate enol-lactonase [Yoonia sp. I 8.24]|uniref:3-oxoadipate enol-lactonase n=1 Tax=Yoonia sp. I 8.24 TaxID=1537229 RepID=UPI001EE0CC44|nr:3-oxoadipate enol-lactonase [Yoonia sp. I 8.24]MCG3267025.1 3-oxoadipate enol-lactonase [Yoonia sp. I 8.24]
MDELTQIDRDGVKLNVFADGPADAPAIVFANSLGTDLRLWDGIIPLLPKGLRVIRYDMRGHGQSDVPAGPYTMGQLVSDAEAVCDAFALRDVLFVGLSVGGMVAQGLAIKRPDLVRALVLSNTAAKIGNKNLWQDRIDTVSSKGLDAMADEVMKRWFSPTFYASNAMLAWRDMLVATPINGYVGICHAIAGTDFYTPTSGLRIPTLGIAGSEDGATPPDLVRETIDLIPGSKFELMRRVGHLPCAENPVGYASLLNTFIQDIGHG